MPLVNAFFVGLADKDAFNASHPSGDARWRDAFAYPSFPALIQAQRGHAAPSAPRQDLPALYLNGLEGLNRAGSAQCEVLRLDTAVAPRAKNFQNPLGALGCFDPGPVFNPSRSGCDRAGFPNGRRPGDDVTDITLRLAMGALLPEGQAPDGRLAYSDGMPVNDFGFFGALPYLPTPHFPHKHTPPSAPPPPDDSGTAPTTHQH